MTSANISNTVLELTELNAVLFDTDEANTAKISLFQETIANGHYVIHPETIADRLMELSDKKPTKNQDKCLHEKHEMSIY